MRHPRGWHVISTPCGQFLLLLLLLLGRQAAGCFRPYPSSLAPNLATPNLRPGCGRPSLLDIIGQYFKRYELYGNVCDVPHTRFMLTLMCFPLPHTSPWYTSHPTYLPFEVLSSLTTYPPRIFYLEQTAIDAMHLHRNLAFHTSMYSEGSMYFSGIKVQQVSLHWGTYLNKHPHPLSRSSAW